MFGYIHFPFWPISLNEMQITFELMVYPEAQGIMTMMIIMAHFR